MPHPSPDRAYRWHKDNTKSGYIRRRRTFSPTNISPVLQMMDIQVVCGGIKLAARYIFLSVYF